ncbi:MAG: aminodeoxychorismate lyase [Anaerolineae bacterium]|nr:MAG: aminodeoxychorismate lyase [Anaerolineae bacterium]
MVQPDDTLFAFVLGAGGTVTVDDLMAANCLDSRYLRVDQVIYLPPGAAENAPPSVPAGPATDLGLRGPRTPNCPCTLVVREGWRREQIADAVNAAQTLFTGGDFLAVTGPDVAVPFDFAMERPPGTSLEGFLFPGTYTVQNDTTAEQFRDMLLSAFAANVGPQMRTDATAQGVSFYQALIIASIVQRESRAPEIQPLIASVLYNRLRDGNRLAQTVTVQYALGRPGDWWPRVTASGLQVNSPYNSYTRPGLPPTPIDSPGLSAIRAAVYPAQTEYRYHTAACGGGVAFAVTYEEHLANLNCE